MKWIREEGGGEIERKAQGQLTLVRTQGKMCSELMVFINVFLR
jgi:hypothetical protein